MLKSLQEVLILGIIIILVYLYNYNQIKKFRIRDIKIKSNKISKTVKITQISDFHSNNLIALGKLTNEILEFDPDFIVLTGDIIGDSDDNLNIVSEFLDALISLNKDIYFVQGNHEDRNRLYDDFKLELENRGIIILEDGVSSVKAGENDINIIGLKYIPLMEVYHSEAKYKKILENLNSDHYNLLLIHAPSNLEKLVRGKEDLILSGHTHGGQIRFPIIGALIAPDQGFFPKLDKGLFKIGNTTLYIDSGLGNSLLPIRALNPVQFSNITIEEE